MTLSRARCTNHIDRQASGLCPTCSRPYCRECLTEHSGRLTCAACLKRAAPTAKTRARWTKHVTAPAMLLGALLASWFFFYTVGSTLEMMSAPAPMSQKGAR
jgi:hypothetical protein